MAEGLHIAVVLSAFNRRSHTLRFLDSLQRATASAGCATTIVLVDDASTDGTGAAVAELHPDVRIIRGDGYLFWAGSVRKAMTELDSELDQLDGILLANDDVVLLEDSIAIMTSIAHTQGAIVGGAVYTHDGQLEATGGRLGRWCKPKQHLLTPDGTTQQCDILPAHALYIPTSIYRRLGAFDPNFSHGHIDLEYSIRALRHGVRMLLAPANVAFTDTVHDYQRDLSNLDLSPSLLLWRWRFNPKSPPISEGVRYLRMLAPFAWPLWVIPYYRGYVLALARSFRRQLARRLHPITRR
jgi:GT2 family glycosyltransferase